MKRRITPVFPTNLKPKDVFVMVIIAIIVFVIVFLSNKKAEASPKPATGISSLIEINS